ncbi:unnamed protein product [Cyprideis torosa]|uniref:Uncharacterized protein n=1 Tax=Cyprideis torosa TaxID=163714 RepID=A0A7R8W553_9CRUS|nr:unnamed protein product [Cyprideis torosa]CAG0880535.1 unnamed protein product [Cyprideis torosa]
MAGRPPFWRVPRARPDPEDEMGDWKVREPVAKRATIPFPSSTPPTFSEQVLGFGVWPPPSQTATVLPPPLPSTFGSLPASTSMSGQVHPFNPSH